MRRMSAPPILVIDEAVAGGRRWGPPRWLRRARLLALAAAGLAMLAVPAWMGATGRLNAALSRATIDMVARSASAGLVIKTIWVDGRGHTPEAALAEALSMEPGDPLLGFDLDAVRARIEALPWVRQAVVERQLSGAIHLRLTEREPIAVWQDDGRYQLVDMDGTPFEGDVAEYAALPQVVGEDAPAHTADLIAMLRAEPALAKRVKAAVRVAERRWNLRLDSLDSGIDVALPEDDAEDAWHRLAVYEREHGMLERRLTAIDLRLPDRVVVRVGTLGEPTPRPLAPPAGKEA